jgi:putative RNA 2'-phosphotransferase
MAAKKTTKQLSRFIANILGNCPHEFGLIPDSDGFVKLKDLLKVIVEEPGWRHVRRGDIDELLLVEPSLPFEIQDSRIRAFSRSYAMTCEPDRNPPKLLYTWVRRKAHPVIMEKGIRSAGMEKVVLTSDLELAERIGKRIDNEPVILTVQVTRSMEQGVTFFKTGDSLYLSDSIPPGCFTGPPLPKVKPEAQKEKPAEEPEEKIVGAFLLERLPDKVRKVRESKKDFQGKKKDIFWKKERKHRQKSRWSEF